jgi:hypothetical protein
MWGCSSVGRAPALQAGGQRFDPVQLHQTLIHCFQIASRLHSRELLAFPFEGQREPIWKQAAPSRKIWQAGFSTALGRAVRETAETVWMFDNEIDWVMRIGRLFLVLLAVRRVEG